jgi:hypothetical protein
VPSARVLSKWLVSNGRTARRSVPASAPVKAFDQVGESPIQANVTGLKSTVVTAFL